MPDTFATVLIVPKTADRADEIETVLRKLADIARDEGPGVLTYAYFKADDGVYRMLERYSNAEAELHHVAHLDYDRVGRLAELADFRDLEILGDTTPELDQLLAPFGPLHRRFVTGVI